MIRVNCLRFCVCMYVCMYVCVYVCVRARARVYVCGARIRVKNGSRSEKKWREEMERKGGRAW